MGHEFAGTVVKTGSSVRSVQVGDKIVSPFTVSWWVSETGTLTLHFPVF